jgi:hypothetical protein
MSTVTTPWYVAAGWALELFTGDASRDTAISKSPYQQYDSVKQSRHFPASTAMFVGQS